MESMPSDLPRPVRQFIEGLEAMMQRVVVEVEKGGAKAGNWWVDLGTTTGHLTVEWSPQRGFGLYEQTEEPVFGAQPLEFFSEPALMLRRATQLLDDGQVGSIGLRELRELHSLSQAELAKRLGVQQAAVSRVERRSDLHLDTLITIVEALGGTLDMRVKFANCEVPLRFGK